MSGLATDLKQGESKVAVGVAERLRDHVGGVVSSGQTGLLDRTAGGVAHVAFNSGVNGIGLRTGHTGRENCDEGEREAPDGYDSIHIVHNRLGIFRIGGDGDRIPGRL
jgi:hypothetical protein